MEKLFKALGSNTRLEILMLITHKTMNVNELASHFEISKASLSYHLNILKKGKLVYYKRIDTQHLYFINRDALTILYNWFYHLTN